MDNNSAILDGTTPFVIQLPPPDRFEPTCIAKLEPNQRNVNLQVIVIKINQPQKTREGHEVYSLKVADKTGSIYLNVWNTVGKLIRESDILRLTNCITQVFKNSLCIKLGRLGSIQRTNDFLMDFSDEPDMSILALSAPEMLKLIKEQQQGGQKRHFEGTGGNEDNGTRTQGQMSAKRTIHTHPS
ncbi:unnamed protein product [Didymodactylos carnosus]|uniref:Uncharacterized protein n=1 Tax=Didymodactylos carnosus TaxID=1234261 RepID=A0A813YIJ3_9BILA|nr:unnamed protein product [Didymodactylos carnosus]CAF0884690.1 unnamed protein product [Didymodactylos carnosus]CAF3511413.1 unnamed protein product [Didymodactylos carnosus]CAF3670153.1 unnamed protein product [Didymodactylos carnosus]